jgi:tripartite-type tricarboxylate transporter receptor subunit TctC
MPATFVLAVIGPERFSGKLGQIPSPKEIGYDITLNLTGCDRPAVPKPMLTSWSKRSK